MAGEDKTKGKLRVTAGAGEGYEINAEIAARHKGQPVRDALVGIIDQEIHDPELRKMLHEPRLAVELYGENEAGEPEELPISPTEQWDQVLKKLEDADVELGIARSHAGGATQYNKARRRYRALEDRFPRQTVLRHPVEYLITDEDQASVQSGQAVFFTGEVVAKVQFICRILGGREGLWYYASSKCDPGVIKEIIIPEQTASAGYCRCRGSEPLKAARSARKRQLKIVGAGHSHGRMGVFSSGTDWEQMAELAREGVAGITVLGEKFEGRVQQAERDDEGISRWHVSFPKGPPVDIWVSCVGAGDPDIRPEGLAVELEQSGRRAMSWFATHNYYGEHLVPMLETVSCPSCGAKRERHVDPENTVVHIIGPVKLQQGTKAGLRKEVKNKVGVYSYWGSGGDKWTDAESSDDPATAAATEAETDTAKHPAPFNVYRHGEFVGTIPAATLERAAAETPSLAESLGWESVGEEPDEQEKPSDA